jgi:hypothetical protein
LNPDGDFARSTIVESILPTVFALPEIVESIFPDVFALSKIARKRLLFVLSVPVALVLLIVI